MPRRDREITLANQIRFLLGRQATLGQAPPSSPRSTITVRRRLSRVHAANLPAIPLPIVRSSYSQRWPFYSPLWLNVPRDSFLGKSIGTRARWLM
jgi:hypothetical protein